MAGALMGPSMNTRVWVAAGVTDMRCGFVPWRLRCRWRWLGIRSRARWSYSAGASPRH